MICEERLLKVLCALHVSEKTSFATEKNNTVIFKVVKDATKSEIKAAIQKLFDVEVKIVNVSIVKRKAKRYGKNVGYRNSWKKAYVTLKEGQNLDFISYNK